MTPAERNAVRLELERGFRPYLSVKGMKYFEKGTAWQIKRHIFERLFYYIDYCLAQSVALQFLALMQKNRADAWEKYEKFVSLGGTLTFTETVAEAGLRPPFEPGALQDAASAAAVLALSGRRLA